MAEYRVGCSGWIYPHWAGLFYPEGLPEREWFQFYARVFDTVEVNATFYRFPSEAMVKAWLGKAPQGFLFTLKAFRGITHLRKFRGTEELVRRFYQRGEILAEKLGGFLFQLPPNLKYNRDLLLRILDQLDPRHRNTLEFRHPSWFTEEVVELLRERGVAMCIVSAPELPELVVTSAKHAFVRFHGKGVWYAHRYSKRELEEWAKRVRELPVEVVFCYFNNDWNAWAVENAQTLKELLSPPSETGDKDSDSCAR